MSCVVERLQSWRCCSVACSTFFFPFSDKQLDLRTQSADSTMRDSNVFAFRRAMPRMVRRPTAYNLLLTNHDKRAGGPATFTTYGDARWETNRPRFHSPGHLDHFFNNDGYPRPSCARITEISSAKRFLNAGIYQVHYPMFDPAGRSQEMMRQP